MSEAEVIPKTPTWQVVMRVIISMICVIGFILAALAFRKGALMNLLTVGLMAGCIVVPLARLPYMIKKEIVWSFWKAPFSVDNRRYWRPILLRVAFWLLCAFVVVKAVVHAQFAQTELTVILAITWAMAIFLSLISFFPKRVGGKPMSIFAAIGTAFLAVIVTDSLFPQLSGKGAVAVHSPFQGESYMAHAGHNKLVNYHVAYTSQKHAFDVLVVNENGQSRDGPADDLESYICWGKPLIAPVKGEVVTVISDLPDQAINGSDPKNPAGNHVVIMLDETHYALLGHMQQGSAVVAEGDQVDIGDVLGKCGNSGNTSEPHLHFQVQRFPDLFAKGGFTYPVKFDGTTRLRGGHVTADDGLFYRRNDRMSPRK